jgi:hypothetical protein
MPRIVAIPISFSFSSCVFSFPPLFSLAVQSGRLGFGFGFGSGSDSDSMRSEANALDNIVDRPEIFESHCFFAKDRDAFQAGHYQ